LIYGFLAYTAVSLLEGSRGAQSAQQRGYAAQVMSHPGGRWVVGAVGLAIVVAGAVMVVEGLKQKFMRYFPPSALTGNTRDAVRRLGTVGTIARGLVFALTGSLVVSAAWTYDAAKASGLDGALKTLRDRPYGELLLGLAAAGLIVFGIYGLAEARYRRV
jgi:O-antigen/teichoic acid export membrane protein